MSVALSNYSMMMSGVNLTNSSDVVANSRSVIENRQGDWFEILILSTLDPINTIAGLPVATLNSLHKLSEAITSDANFLIIWCLLLS